MLKMSLTSALMIFVSFFTLQSNAQYPYPPSQQPIVQYPYPQMQPQVQYCYLDQNPHSWACMAWTFAGTQEFPLYQIDWKGQIEGEWETITYANPWSDNIGQEFQMLKNSSNPRIPEGVINRESGQLMGDLSIHGDRIIWNNWRGRKLKSFDEATLISSPYEFKFTLKDTNGYQQAFVCHDFNRNNKHHLLCSWFVITMYPNGSYTWLHHGYFGFLKVGSSEQPAPPTNQPPIPYYPGQPPTQQPGVPQLPPTQPSPPPSN
jgi:hypothetical protein